MAEFRQLVQIMQAQQDAMAQVVQSQQQPSAQSNEAWLRMAAVLSPAGHRGGRAQRRPGVNVKDFVSLPRFSARNSEWRAFH